MTEVRDIDREAAEAFFPVGLWKQQARDDVAQAFAAHRETGERSGATAERVHLIGWLKVCGMPGAKEIADALERDVDHLFSQSRNVRS